MIQCREAELIQKFVDREILTGVDGALRRAVELFWQDYQEMQVKYDERGMAMRETGDMVRSLYGPKNERLNKENHQLTKRVAELERQLSVATRPSFLGESVLRLQLENANTKYSALETAFKGSTRAAGQALAAADAAATVLKSVQSQFYIYPQGCEVIGHESYLSNQIRDVLARIESLKVDPPPPVQNSGP